ncbi:MAG: sulfatase-like hydrolase/transferase, partial [Bacteroidota bacterium]
MRIKPLNIISVIVISVLIMSACNQAEEMNKQPNILWIVADDLGTDLGCYGTPLVKTPSLDKFAEQSIRFENAHTVTAVCSPSRSALITGMYPVSIDCHQHRTRNPAKKPLPEGIKVITEYFEEAGYFTFNGQYGKKDQPGKTDYNFTTDYDIYDGTDWNQRAEGQPFFGQIQIHFPHRPFANDTINPIDESQIKLPPYLPDHWVARQDWAQYLETIQVVDNEVGEVLKRLEE